MTDFSYLRCLEKPALPMLVLRRAVHRALRIEITPQIDAFRADYFPRRGRPAV